MKDTHREGRLGEGRNGRRRRNTENGLLFFLHPPAAAAFVSECYLPVQRNLKATYDGLFDLALSTPQPIVGCANAIDSLLESDDILY